MSRVLCSALVLVCTQIAFAKTILQARQTLVIPAGQAQVSLLMQGLAARAGIPGYSICDLQAPPSLAEQTISEGSKFELLSVGEFTTRELTPEELIQSFEPAFDEMELSGLSVAEIVKRFEARYGFRILSTLTTETELKLKSQATGSVYSVTCSVPENTIESSSLNAKTLIELMDRFGRLELVPSEL